MSTPDHVGGANKMVVDDAYLAERRKLAEAATPGFPPQNAGIGPWPGWHRRQFGREFQVFSCSPHDGAAPYHIAVCHLAADAAFIADARASMPLLLDEVERLREENEKRRGLLAEVAGSGVELQDDRMRYLVVQIGRDLWAQVTEASKS